MLKQPPIAINRRSVTMHCNLCLQKENREVSLRCVYYSTIQISFSDLEKEIGNHSVISIFHFQFENEI